MSSAPTLQCCCSSNNPVADSAGSQACKALDPHCSGWLVWPGVSTTSLNLTGHGAGVSAVALVVLQHSSSSWASAGTLLS